MDCLKWWLEILAAVMTIVAVPIAIWIFYYERRDKFIAHWADRFYAAFQLDKMDESALIMRWAYANAKKPWITIRAARNMSIAAAIQASERKGASPLAAIQFAAGIWANCQHKYFDSKMRPKTSKLSDLAKPTASKDSAQPETGEKKGEKS